MTQFLWAGQQTIEKYLKCILLLNRIEAKKVRHDLGKAMAKIKASGKLSLDLTRGTEEFERLDQYGQYRYLEVSTVAFGIDLVTLDRAVWELRRCCTLRDEPKKLTLRDGFAAPLLRIPGGVLEAIIADSKNPARKPLIWNTPFLVNGREKGLACDDGSRRTTRRFISIRRFWTRC